MMALFPDEEELLPILRYGKGRHGEKCRIGWQRNRIGDQTAKIDKRGYVKAR